MLTTCHALTTLCILTYLILLRTLRVGQYFTSEKNLGAKNRSNSPKAK